MTYKLTLAAQHKSYDIIIGEQLNKFLCCFLKQNFPASKIAIIYDKALENYLSELEQDLSRERPGQQILTIPLKACESNKSFRALENITETCLKSHITRQDILIAFGGGIICDIAGFSAAIIHRSMSYIQIPTSLLAQIDASIGGKTAINSYYGKNLIGSFHQPELVLCDSYYLTSLSERDFWAGYGEMLKYSLIDSYDFFDLLDKNCQNLRREQNLLQKTIEKCCAIKAALVEKDEYDKNERALLNLGHSFGHALERYYNYDQELLRHGEAVILGIELAFRFSVKCGYLAPSELEKLTNHISANNIVKYCPLPRLWQKSGKPKADLFLDYMLKDKKNHGPSLTLILARQIGEAFMAKNIDKKLLYDFLIEQAFSAS